jgi:hypothetical protein
MVRVGTAKELRALPRDRSRRRVEDDLQFNWPGESWRSKFDGKRNLIVVNNGHRDFVYASRSKSLKLRYLVRLYAKELVLHNFAGLPADHLLERMVELSLRTEEHL